MGGWPATRSTLILSGRVANYLVSFVVFSFLDLLDVFLCLVYHLLDYALEAEWKPCYCSSSPNDMIASSGNILVSSAEDDGGPKILCLSSTKLHLEDISNTLYSRSSLISDLSKNAMVSATTRRPTRKSPATATFTIHPTVLEMLQGNIKRQQSNPAIPRWTDCDCKACNSWTSSNAAGSLFVHADAPKDGAAKEDVVFIHGFISCSTFWTETVFPHFTEATKSTYRLFAVDLLGFGKSPKPADSLYTLGEHVDMIERSVLDRHKVGSFHIVAHSLGCIIALALAVRHPGAVKSLTLVAPPYFPADKGEEGAQFVMRRVAPRRVWPPMALAASLACWYEHISRTICFLICKNHRLWVFIFKLITRNRMRTFLMEGFFCHTHNAAWHTLHNIICGSAGKMDGYLDVLREKLISCDLVVFHGRNDELLPVDCGYAVKSRVPRCRLNVLDNKDHITVLLGREKAFAGELEDIWRKGRR